MYLDFPLFSCFWSWAALTCLMYDDAHCLPKPPITECLVLGWTGTHLHAVSKGLSSREVPNLELGYFSRCKACITKDPEHITDVRAEGLAGQWAEEHLRGEADWLWVSRARSLGTEGTRGSALPEISSVPQQPRLQSAGPNKHGLWTMRWFPMPNLLAGYPGPAVTASARVCPARLWGGPGGPRGVPAVSRGPAGAARHPRTRPAAGMPRCSRDAQLPRARDAATPRSPPRRPRPTCAARPVWGAGLEAARPRHWQRPPAAARR